MKLVDILPSNAISVELSAASKKEVLEELCALLGKAGKLPDPKAMVHILEEREALGSTGIGQGVAIPHGKAPSIKAQAAALGISRRGVDFDSLDGEPVHIVFLLIAPPDAAGNHLKALAKVSRLLKDKFFRQALKDSKSADEILKIIREEDEY
ncbi:MAG: PTS sugar transporter subunit IIA [Elusimicrobia bacterium]|mgnify:CR=1 FL=1|jgi:PTS system nitrogen regulatory IIA component|nr:PTS sugar transporter subunit IIA [Elusimicrobiota bacterium]